MVTPKSDNCLHFFPLSNVENNKEFCLRIRNRLKKGKFIRLVVVLSSFKKYKDGLVPKSVWLIRFPIGYSYQTDVLIKLSYPKLSFSIEKNQYEGELVKTNLSSLISKELYRIHLFKANHPYSAIGNVLFEA